MSTKLESPKVQSTLELIGMLRPGEHEVVTDVSWDEYETLLEELGEACSVRVSYAQGTLEVMAPLFRHERTKEFILRLVDALTQELGLKLEAAGSTTLKRKDLSRGVEPDTCFYIQNAEAIAARNDLDLRFDPPPDIVFEVDVTSKSHSKIATYAELGVAEFWRYDGESFQVYGLSEGRFVERETSIAFPFLRSSDLQDFVELSTREGQAVAIEYVRRWIRERKITF
jgi:Uma2 family endonuclease